MDDDTTDRHQKYSQMRVVVFEPDLRGHRYHFVAIVLPVIKKLTKDVHLVTTRRGFESDQYQIHLASLEDRFTAYECDHLPASTPLKYAQRRVHLLGEAVKALSPDHLFVPCADGMTPLISMSRFRGRSKVPADIWTEGLHFGGGYGYRSLRGVKRVQSRFNAFLSRRRAWSVFGHVDPWQLKALAGRIPSASDEHFLLVPDPATRPPDISRDEARRELSIPTDGKYLGCAGPISQRKGIDVLMAAFAASVPQLAADTRLLLAGQFDSKIRQLLDSDYRGLQDKQRIVVCDRHLTEREMDIVIPAMDLVCAPYPDHLGSSGIVLRAAAAHRPVLAANQFWMERTIPLFKLGTTCNVLDHQEFVHAIVREIDRTDDFELTDAARRYLDFQSIENFRVTYVAHLNRRLGHPPSPQRLNWDWVLAALGN